MENYSNYRTQIVANDLFHIGLAVLAVFVQLGLTIACHVTNDSWYATWIPLFTVLMLGLIMRLDTLVHRLGGFLKSRGDEWELALEKNPASKKLIGEADALIMVPSLVMFCYAEYRAWSYFDQTAWGIIYPAVTITLILLGISGWVIASARASRGFDSKE